MHLLLGLLEGGQPDSKDGVDPAWCLVLVRLVFRLHHLTQLTLNYENANSESGNASELAWDPRRSDATSSMNAEYRNHRCLSGLLGLGRPLSFFIRWKQCMQRWIPPA
jgi:hypothetical protein